MGIVVVTLAKKWERKVDKIVGIWHGEVQVDSA
jgi:hypothetical protein